MSLAGRRLRLPQHQHVESGTDSKLRNFSAVDDGNAAAMELWDLIHAPRNLYQQAQRNRTLNHPTLPQPTPEEEERYLQELSQNDSFQKIGSSQSQSQSQSLSLVQDKNQTSTSASASASELTLEERLATALEKAGLSRSRTEINMNMNMNMNSHFDGHNDKDQALHQQDASPTSTLQFPVDPEPLMSLAQSHHQFDSVSSQDFFYSDTHTPTLYDMGADVNVNVNVNVNTDKITARTSATATATATATVADEVYDLHENQHQVTHISSEIKQHSDTHTFVVCADTQLGMTNDNREWETELVYARQAVHVINQIQPPPAFVSVCGDLVDMESSFYMNRPNSPYTLDQCHEIQDKQNQDFKQVWSMLDERIALVCLCGNHDIGNRPTKSSIDRFKSAFGDDYLAFWTNGTYNIVLNNVLFHDPSGAPDLFQEQLDWLEDRLIYANKYKATQIFVFGHHPWFLYHEDEDDFEMSGKSPFPKEWNNPDPDAGFPDYYFHIRKEYRMIAMKLFKKYNVSAAFSGHFHQNLVSKTSWGMDMIVTAPLSILLESNGKPAQTESNARGIRIVEVQGRKFKHNFEQFEFE